MSPAQSDKRPAILVAEDDEDDCLLIRDALEENKVNSDVRFVRDGRELIEYLSTREGQVGGVPARPDLILMDLNMPRKDGREALSEIKADPGLKDIPVVILTTSGGQQDVDLCYRLGAALYIIKPMTYEDLIDALAPIRKYLNIPIDVSA